MHVHIRELELKFNALCEPKLQWGIQDDL